MGCESGDNTYLVVEGQGRRGVCLVLTFLLRNLDGEAVSYPDHSADCSAES